MQSNMGDSPYRSLGHRLKSLREKHRESLAEVSGAVEIDTDLLEKFEQGAECPSEDVLTLLISHFDLHYHEAVELWDTAAFSRPTYRPDYLSDLSHKTTLVLFGIDAPVHDCNALSV